MKVVQQRRNNFYSSSAKLHPRSALFNLFLNDLFLVVTHSHLSNYIDGNTLYCSGSNTNDVNDKLRIDSVQVMKQFNENYMVLNAHKWHYIYFGKNTCKILLGVLTLTVEKRKYQELPQITLFCLIHISKSSVISLYRTGRKKIDF